MDFKKILGAAALIVAASAALATPQYTGSTTANFNPSAVNNSVQVFGAGTGYYIWNDPSSPNDWYIRWTDISADGGSNPTWFGDISFGNTSTGNIDVFSFENSYDKVLATSTDELFQFQSVTNQVGGIDGINFKIDGGVELVSLSLGSSLFGGKSNSTATNGGEQSQSANLIYIGQDFNRPDVLIASDDRGTYQSFDIVFVPEPATIALFGLGIAGLIASRRRNKNVAD